MSMETLVDVEKQEHNIVFMKTISTEILTTEDVFSNPEQALKGVNGRVMSENLKAYGYAATAVSLFCGGALVAVTGAFANNGSEVASGIFCMLLSKSAFDYSNIHNKKLNIAVEQRKKLIEKFG